MPTEYKSAKDMLLALIVAVVGTDENGRPLGLSYEEMRRLVLAAFPVNVWPGPHQGKPTRMKIKHIREIAYQAQSLDRTLRLPRRPRANRKVRHAET